MNAKRWGLAAVLCLGLVAAGCSNGSSGGNGTSSSSSTSGGTTAVKVGMALPGPRNDKAFSQAHYEGLQQIEKNFGVKGSVVDNAQQPQAALDALKNLAADNDLVIGVGAEFADAGTVVAPQFPDVQFVIINGQATDDKNLHIYFVRQGVPAYVAGVVAAMLTKAKQIGFVGGAQIPPTTQSDDAFKAGILATDPSIKYATTTIGDFNDAAKGKEATAAQIDAGADVVFPFLDAGFPGAEQAVTESGKDVLLFNPIYTRCSEADNIVGFTYLNSAQYVESIYKDFQSNSLPTEPKAFGIEDPNIQTFTLCPKFDTPDLSAAVKDTITKINSGEIKLPEGV